MRPSGLRIIWADRQGNLTIRKVYGRDGIGYLRCRICQYEFSERKGTALWNCKVPEAQAIAVSEHLGEGCSFKATARLVRVDAGTVRRRLCRQFGRHAQQFHDMRARELVVDHLQADERYGFVARRSQPSWEAEIIGLSSKFILSHVQGWRNGDLIRALLAEGASQLRTVTASSSSPTASRATFRCSPNSSACPLRAFATRTAVDVPTSATASNHQEARLTAS